MTVELCTVDRFQGHEADRLVLSFTSAHPTSFLESPNRLHVALSRARHQRVVVGDRNAMVWAKASALGVFAAHEAWERQLTGGPVRKGITLRRAVELRCWRVSGQVAKAA